MRAIRKPRMLMLDDGSHAFAVPRRPKRLRPRRADRRNPLDHAAMSTRSATMKGLLNHSIATATIPWMRRPDAPAADRHAVLAIPAGARETRTQEDADMGWRRVVPLASLASGPRVLGAGAGRPGADRAYLRLRRHSDHRDRRDRRRRGMAHR